MNTEPIEPRSKKINLSLDYRAIIAVLVVIILLMLALWRPWQPRYAGDARTIDVSGKATISAMPDQFVFSPTYDFTNADKSAALATMTAKSNEIVGKLKGLGVPNSGIKTNADSYDNYPVENYTTPLYPIKGGSGSTYTLSLTVTVTNSKLAQKVQDYLVTTSPSGEVTPQADFSDAKQHQLESQARDQATKDARSKAEQSAHNLGFRLGAVKNVQDDAGFGGVYPLATGGAKAAISADQQLPVQPGENQLSYTVTVTYFLR